MKVIAMFLPQFHEDDKNNSWWGKGFTEWDNVKKSKPLFKGHLQPEIPLNGYFDLLSNDEISNQFKEAKSYGVDSFSFYTYWSCGDTVLNKPLEYISENSDVEVDYSITWANHDWTRSWKNRSGSLDVLFRQEYSANDVPFFEYLLKHFEDPRYTRVDGKPLFTIYRIEDVDNFECFIVNLRNFCLERGVEIHVSAFVNNSPSVSLYALCDSLTLFQPTLSLFSGLNIFKDKTRWLNPRVYNANLKKLLYKIQDLFPKRYKIHSYLKVSNKLVRQYLKTSESTNMPINPMVFTGFDNTPRYGKRARIIRGSTPHDFFSTMKDIVNSSSFKNGNELLFINAWNEWGEGMHLQPDIRNMYDYLQAVKRVKDEYSNS